MNNQPVRRYMPKAHLPFVSKLIEDFPRLLANKSIHYSNVPHGWRMRFYELCRQLDAAISDVEAKKFLFLPVQHKHRPWLIEINGGNAACEVLC